VYETEATKFSFFLINSLTIVVLPVPDGAEITIIKGLLVLITRTNI